MVLFRLLQGVFGAALVPLSQAVMLDTYALHERAKAMSIWGMGVMMGPIMGPSLGAWLTETYSWHWVFFVNLPFGIFTVLGLIDLHGRDQEEPRAAVRLVRIRRAGRRRSARCSSRSIAANSSAGSESNEIIAEFIVSGVGFYYFFAHSFTTTETVHPVRDLQGPEFPRRLRVHGGDGPGAVLDHGAVLALSAERDRLSHHHRRPAAGEPGCGTFVAMMLVGRLMRYIEARTLIITGLSMTCLSLFYMTGWTDQTGVHEIVIEHRPGFWLWPGVRAALDRGVPDAAQPSAHRRHLDADPDAQCRKLDRHFHRHRAID